MKVEVITNRTKTSFEGESIEWTNVSGYLKVFVNRQLQAEFQSSSWDAVLVVSEAE